MDKREQLLRAAESVLRSKGLAGATTRAITTKAGCAEGTLYLYFKGRAELFLAVFERHLTESLPTLRSLDRNCAADAHDVLLEIAMEFLAFHRDIVPLLAALFAEPALLKQYRSLITSRVHDVPRVAPALVDYLRTQQGRQRIAPGVAVAVTAQALLGACFARAFHDDMFAKDPNSRSDRKFLRALIARLFPSP